MTELRYIIILLTKKRNHQKESEDNRNLTLNASKWTCQNLFILYDYKIESLWYQFVGENGLKCNNGYYADRNLEEFEYLQPLDRRIPGFKILKENPWGLVIYNDWKQWIVGE